MKFKKLIISLGLLTLFCGCATTNSFTSKLENEPTPTPKQTPSPTPISTIEPTLEPTPTPTTSELMLSSMTLEEKVAQLFIIRPETLTTENAYSIDNSYIENIKNYPVTGFALFSENIIDPTQLSTFTSSLQEHSKIPLFMSIDEEGGLVSRIANNKNFDVPKYPNMGTIGKSELESDATDLGVGIAKYLTEFGFNWDFAPVCDVNTNPNNIVIGNRAFGNDPELVAKMVSAEIEALQSNGVISSAKHFPGHGDTSNDTHSGSVVINKTMEELMDCELIPFISAINRGVDSIMVSHIICPNIDDSNLPSSLSPTICTDLLRNTLGFEGVIITDGMEMGAIIDNYSSDEASILAIKAGVDIILAPENFFVAYDGLLEAVKNGTISEERINESVLRILNLKEQYNIIK